MKLFAVLCFALCQLAHAANTPWVCPSALQGTSLTGNLSKTIFTTASAGWYDVKLQLLPDNTTVGGAATVQYTWTANGTARTSTGISVPVATLNVGNILPVFSVKADAATPVNLSVTSVLGTYEYAVCYRSSNF